MTQTTRIFIPSERSSTGLLFYASLASDGSPVASVVALTEDPSGSGSFAGTTEVPASDWNIEVRNSSGLTVWYDTLSVGQIVCGSDFTLVQKASITSAVPSAATIQSVLLLKVLKYFRLSLRKDAAVATDHATELGELNADTGTGVGGYLNTTDSQEAIKDATGSGGGGPGDASLANQVLMLSNLTTIQSTLDNTIIVTTGFAQVDATNTLNLKRGPTATLTFTSPTSDLFPDMSDSATTKVFFGIRDAAGRIWLKAEGTITTPTGLQVITFTLSAIDSADMKPGVHFYDAVVVYGYDAGSTAEVKYTSQSLFTTGRVRVFDNALVLTEL